ncbi:hypothetical protein EI171_29120 [Bradyrhizobium sp. LCT2]|uniref:hypothetical protein n=1 Tax=Bradyrhizobium sp. LCT2 TaxID=2493093 RepID=UPI00137447D6|nr:hypothetical protein [Bradyrhizobium sp. LCT2]QHP70997.1 hypothetical protein EI171_29120 [Bradyrhizobium sp. LCT2]
MKQRGRVSGAARDVLGLPADTTERPDAPYTLTDAETAEWRAIVAAMPPQYFARTQYPLLTQLCRHITASNRISLLIESLCKRKSIDCTELISLHAAQAAETAAIIRLSRSMRLTHQSVYRASATGRLTPQPVIEAPWRRGKVEYSK